MRRMSLWCLLGFALGFSACLFDGDETEGLPCTNDDHCGIGLACTNGLCGGGDACAAGQAVCITPDVIQSCTMDQLVDTPCNQICANDLGLGSAFGCAANTQSGSVGCYCDPSASLCDSPGEVECWNGDDARQCQNGFWDHIDCDEICELDGLGSATHCEPSPNGVTCFCTSPDPCQDGRQFCRTDSTLAVCSNGGWIDIQCGDGCGSTQSLGCGFFEQTGDETCLCGA
jgi:hypothetical protein